MRLMDQLDAERRARFVAYFNGSPLHGDRAALMRKTGYSKGRVNHFLDIAQPFGQKAAANLASRLGLATDAFERANWISEQHTSGGAYPGGVPPKVAHDLSHISTEDAPLLLWRDDMLKSGTPIFWVALVDDSMAPRADVGKRVCFDRNMAPRRGDGILVTDRSGATYFRKYKPGTAGRFTAEALNPDYAPLDSERDGLSILAVLKAEEGRWG